MAGIFWAVVSFLLSQVVVTFFVAAAAYATFALLMPVVVTFAGDYFGLSGFDTLLAAVPDGVYWGLYFFRLDVGLPAMFAAIATRFIVRRIHR